MITSTKEYNELLYTIKDPNYNSMVPVEIGEDGYPLIIENILYFYSTNYIKFNGDLNDIKTKWPLKAELPGFYRKNKNNVMIRLESDVDGYPILDNLEENAEIYYKHTYTKFQGTIQELKTKWPTSNLLPTFYRKNLDAYYRIPSDEPVYYIDLNTREVETPKFLSVLEDHNAEVIWFKMDRFHDDVDLYGATCWIVYENALKETHISIAVPKVIDLSNHDMLYIPWPVTGAATAAAGKITFTFQIFKIGESGRVLYNLHTKPATSQILHGMHVDPFNEENNLVDNEMNPQFTELKSLLLDLSSKYATLSGKYNLYWNTAE